MSCEVKFAVVGLTLTTMHILAIARMCVYVCVCAVRASVRVHVRARVNLPPPFAPHLLRNNSTEPKNTPKRLSLGFHSKIPLRCFVSITPPLYSTHSDQMKRILIKLRKNKHNLIPKN